MRAGAPSAHPWNPRAPHWLALVVILGLGVAAPAAAEPTAEEKRTAAQTQKAEAAAELNTLRASDEELEAAVRALDAGVQVQSSDTQAAEQALGAAESNLGSAQSRLAATEARMGDLRQRAAAVAIQAYVHPGGDPLLQIVGAKDLAEASRRQTLLSTVVARDRDVLDQLRSARQDQQSERENVARARDLAEERRSAAAARLAELEQALADQSRLQSALETRIDQLSAEVDALAREEAALSALILTRQASSGGTQSGAPRQSSGGGMIWPTTGSTTSSFGDRWGRLHAGLDIANDLGTPISAAQGGTVILAGWNGGYGNSVVIDHGGGLSTLYAHASNLIASEGQVVEQGELIAEMGSSGNSTGSHLHFETRLNGSPRDPTDYLS